MGVVCLFTYLLSGIFPHLSYQREYRCPQPVWPPSTPARCTSRHLSLVPVAWGPTVEAAGPPVSLVSDQGLWLWNLGTLAYWNNKVIRLLLKKIIWYLCPINVTARYVASFQSLQPNNDPRHFLFLMYPVSINERWICSLQHVFGVTWSNAAQKTLKKQLHFQSG